MAFDGSVDFIVRSDGEDSILIIERTYKKSKFEPEIIILKKSDFFEIQDLFKNAMQFDKSGRCAKP